MVIKAAMGKQRIFFLSAPICEAVTGALDLAKFPSKVDPQIFPAESLAGS